jgi:peptidyl-prolyl cis-trans isomerase D
MALLGKIRSQFGWLMIVMVVLGVGGFLLMDATSFTNKNINNKVVVGTVNGKKISPDMIDKGVSEMENSQAIQAEKRAFAWNKSVSQLLLTQQVEAAGLAVSDKEMGELFLGDYGKMSNRVFEYFKGDAQTGQIDKNYIRQNLEAYDAPEMLGQEATPELVADFKKRIENLREDVKSDRLSQKYGAMLQQGAYTPTWMANAEHNRQNQSFDLQFVRIPYSAISNEQAPVSDDDLKKYIQENPSKYKREATASIKFVAFDVRPTGQDSASYLKEMTDASMELKSFTVSADDSTFFGANTGIMPFAYLSKDDFDEEPNTKDSIFNAGVGTTFGPYIHNNAYKVLKIMDSKELSDSVRYRRVVYPVNQQEQNGQQLAFIFLDSLKNLLNTGKANFDSLVSAHSVDMVSKAKGGDMGFVDRGRQQGSEFGANDFMFYQAKKDSFYILGTMTGELQLIQVTDYKLNGKKGLRIGYINKPIIPSEISTNAIKTKAIEFATQNRNLSQFETTAKNQNMRIAEANGLEINGYEIEGIGKTATSATIIAWAHSIAKEGEVAGSVYELPNDEIQKDFTRQFVCPVLVKKNAKGVATIDNPAVKQEVDKIVRNKKKAEVAKTTLGTIASLDVVAQKYPSAQTEISKGMMYSRPMFGATMEAKLAAVADLLPINQISNPIAGENGIYVLMVSTKIPAPALPTPQMAKQDASRRAGSVILNAVFTALKDKATIVDNRGSIYLNE